MVSKSKLATVLRDDSGTGHLAGMFHTGQTVHRGESTGRNRRRLCLSQAHGNFLTSGAMNSTR